MQLTDRTTVEEVPLTGVRDGIRFTSLEAPLDRPIHDRLGRGPGETEEGSGGFDRAARLKDLDGKGFEEEGETAVLPGPWRHGCLHTVIRAAASRQPGDQLRRELHRVEVASAAFFRVIGKAAGLATIGGTKRPIQRAPGGSRLAAPQAEGQQHQLARSRRGPEAGHSASRVCPSRQSTPPRLPKRPAVPRNSLKNQIWGGGHGEQDRW